jgi:hypothetical protein
MKNGLKKGSGKKCKTCFRYKNYWCKKYLVPRKPNEEACTKYKLSPMNKKILTLCYFVSIINLVVGLYLWSQGLVASIFFIAIALILGLCVPNVYLEKNEE